MKPPGHRSSRRRGHRRAREVASVALLVALLAAAVPLGRLAGNAAFWGAVSTVYGLAGRALVQVARRSLGLDHQRRR